VTHGWLVAVCAGSIEPSALVALSGCDAVELVRKSMLPNWPKPWPWSARWLLPCRCLGYTAAVAQSSAMMTSLSSVKWGWAACWRRLRLADCDLDHKGHFV